MSELPLPAAETPPTCRWCGETLARPLAPFCPKCKYGQGDPCRICNTPMPMGAKRCNACGERLPQDLPDRGVCADGQRQLPAGEPPACRWCGETLARPLAPFCPKCKYGQGDPCRICKTPKLRDAKRCNACGTFDDLPPFVTFTTTIPAMLSALLATAALFPLVTYCYDYSSHTSMTVSGASDSAIHVDVWNTGRRPSALIAYRMKVDFPHEPKSRETELLRSEDESTVSVVEPAKPIRLNLGTPKTDTFAGPLYTEAEVQLAIKQKRRVLVTIEVDIRESNDNPGESRTLRHTVTIDQIASFRP